MQWDASANAGFTAGTPWIDVNPNYRQINVREAQADPDSILHFYRKLLALRQRLEVLRSGTFRLLLPEHPQLLAYERACGEERIRVCPYVKTGLNASNQRKRGCAYILGQTSAAGKRGIIRIRPRQ